MSGSSKARNDGRVQEISEITRGLKAVAKELIGEYHGYGPGQYRHYRNEQERRNQPGPYKQWHFHPGHARRTHIKDSNDNVYRAHNG